jgi:hypothetical protein
MQSDGVSRWSRGGRLARRGTHLRQPAGSAERPATWLEAGRALLIVLLVVLGVLLIALVSLGLLQANKLTVLRPTQARESRVCSSCAGSATSALLGVEPGPLRSLYVEGLIGRLRGCSLPLGNPVAGPLACWLRDGVVAGRTSRPRILGCPNRAPVNLIRVGRERASR